MHLIPLKTARLCAHQNLFDVFDYALEVAEETLQEKDILIIASKIVAYNQKRLVNIKNKDEFRHLVKKEADQILDDGDIILTLKDKMLIPNAGIDNSNVPEGQVVLWPKDSFAFAQQFRQQLMEKYNLSELGVLISDSHCQPLRQGTSGLAMGWAGFEGVQDERGAKDLFGREMKYTKIAVADNLASAALLEMGETDASIPFVVARGTPAQFMGETFSADDYFMNPKECLYAPLYGERLK